MEEIKEVKFAPGLTADILFVELQSQGREYLRLMSYYSSAMLEVETKFKVLNIEFSNKFDRNPIESIETRLKKPRSIYEKMNRLGLPISVDAIEKNLNDIAGVRVICSFVDDIYKLADMLAVQDDVYVVRTKDYIKNPKESGYRSLHMIVEVPIFLSNQKRYMRVEVQLRTIAMDFCCAIKRTSPPRRRTRLPGSFRIARRLSRGRTSRCTIFASKLKPPASKPGWNEKSIKNGRCRQKNHLRQRPNVSIRVCLFKSVYSNAENSISCTRRISCSPESPSKT